MATKIITVENPAPEESSGADVNKGAPLNAAEFDQNIVNLKAAVDRRALQTAVDLKAPLASPTFTGTVVLPATTSIGTVSGTELGYVDGVTSGLQAQLNAKAPLTNAALITPTIGGVSLGPYIANLGTGDGRLTYLVADAGEGYPGLMGYEGAGQVAYAATSLKYSAIVGLYFVTGYTKLSAKYTDATNPDLYLGNTGLPNKGVDVVLINGASSLNGKTIKAISDNYGLLLRVIDNASGTMRNLKANDLTSTTEIYFQYVALA